MRTLLGHWTRLTGMAGLVALCSGLAVATPGQAAQGRDFLVGPVTLGPGDTLLVAVANANVAPRCGQPVFVRFLQQNLDGSAGRGEPRPPVAVEQIVKTELGQ